MIDPATRAMADVAMREDETHMIVGPIEKTRWIYATSKHLLERVIHAYGTSRGLDYSIIRPFNFLGPRFDFLPTERRDDSPRMFAQFMDALLQGTQMSLVDGGHALRTYIYIDDASECMGRIILDDTGKCSRQAFNVGNPNNEISVEGFARLMYDIYVERYWDGRSPLPKMVSVPHEEMFGEGYDDCDRRIPDITKARTLLGWEPRWPLRDLVAATMDAFVAEYRRAKGEVARPPDAAVARRA